MQQQIPLPYGSNINKTSRHTYTQTQRAGTSMAQESAGAELSQGHQKPGPGTEVASTESPTTIKDAYQAVKDEASGPLIYSDSYRPKATVAVLDIYQDKPDGPVMHGDRVYSIIAGAGFSDADILKIEHSTASKSNSALSDLLYQDGPEPVGERLNAYIELSAGHMLTKTNGTLGQILATPESPLRTINQSQGSSRVNVYQLLESASIYAERGLEKVSTIGERVAKACGLDPEAPDFTLGKLRQAFVDRINTVIDGSQYISEQQGIHSELLDRLREKGTLVVTSSGNNADELWDYRGKGLRVPDCFDDDLSKVGPKLIVGALDDHGTPERADDEIAFFTSLYGNVNIMANGVNVPTIGGPATGTSFASPVVAGTAAKIRREHPEWSVDQVEQETKSRFTATDGFNILR